ncbi:SDR family oxidoreductase [Microbulbifer sp. THAF38]|uniref:SDR family oxidoreductase n=1 Tax=Microbulbifer sp. THAF38 TaxID=2587856 RepID=UPI001267E188|nr:SDR family oxidoreductase [Microbulbifer sp. THAF38]QFT56554.1 3-oxoacyl-[acyl-carrier-protein] reductase FabG [Microbulbifer sp. THAF38]
MTARETLTVLITGASGGIGSAISRLLAEQGHRLLLQGRNTARLQQLKVGLPHSDRHQVLVADLCDGASRSELVRSCEQLPGGVDVLVNNAGIASFSLLSDIGDAELGRLLHTNLIAPMALTRDLLPTLQRSEHAAIINIGSAFGHIGHPGFGAYGASKAGLHGFTETLRRELAGSKVRVHYLAPRAVDTPLNSDAVNDLNRALGNKSDSPQFVAAQCLRLLQSKHGRRRFIGWPERLFIKVNALLPSLVDSALAKKLPLVRQFVRGRTPPTVQDKTAPGAL